LISQRTENQALSLKQTVSTWYRLLEQMAFSHQSAVSSAVVVGEAKGVGQAAPAVLRVHLDDEPKQRRV